MFREVWKRKGNTFDYLNTLLILCKWLVAGCAIGLIVGAISAVFGHTLLFVNDLREQYPMIVWGLPLGGLLIVFLYRFCKDADDKGTNTIVASIQTSSEIPFRMAPLIFMSTVITHLFGGSAGREGAAIQLGGSIAKKIAKTLKLDENNQRIIIMCGMSAGFSALFGTPMAAAIFSMEVISVGIMHYSALVPCVTASMIAHFVSKAFRLPGESFPVADIPAMDVESFFKIVVFAAVVGGVSLLFCVILHSAEHLYKKYLKNPYIRIFVAGCLVVVFSAILGTDLYLGSGMEIIEEIFHSGEVSEDMSVGARHSVPWFAFLLKMVFTALTLGAGFKGGEIVPSFCIGAAFGCMSAALMGMPAPLITACGMVGVFCGVTNCPITSLLISFELFGFEGMPYYLVAIAVSYMLSGYQSLYKAQRIVYSKTRTEFILKQKDKE